MRNIVCFLCLGVGLSLTIFLGCPEPLIAQPAADGSSVNVPEAGSEVKKDDECTKNGGVKCDTVDSAIVSYLASVGKDEDKAKEAMKTLKCCPMAALAKLGQRLTDIAEDDNKENDSELIPAAELLYEVSKTADESKILDANARESYPSYETLKKNLVKAFLRDDPGLKAPVHKAWLILFPKLNLYTEAPEKTPEIKYKTPYFFLHAGALLLNPYTIEKDGTGTYMLDESGDADTHYFVEAMYRNRYAWLEKQPKYPKAALDYEMRLGIAGSDSDPSGAVVSGAGDAYMEFSVGWLVPPPFNNLKRAEKEGVRWTLNAEGLAGFVTDKGAQEIHFYWGVGPVVAVGIPYGDSSKGETKRRIEVIGGFYLGKTDIPQFEIGDTREIKSEKDFPVFKSETSCIMRGDIHFPFKENGFVTITGRFTKNMEKETIDPWNIAIGYTVPVEVITDSLNKLFNQ